MLSGLFFDPVAGGGGGTQNVSWTNAQGVTVSANSLTKTAVTGWGNAGASSTQTLASGDGYVEFTGAQLGADRILGLSNGDTNQTWEDIDFGLYLRGDNVATVVEFGTYYPQYNVSFTAGDVFRVSVESGVVKYKKNGVVYHTSPGIVTYPLKVDSALYTTNSTLTNAVVGGNWSGGSGGGGSSSSEVLWLVADHLGTPRMILDESGSLANIKRHDYLPFGEELFAGTGGCTTGQGYTASDNVRQKFTSKERDNETGRDYFLARYYSSTQGRFTSPDEFNRGPEELFDFGEDAAENPTFYAELDIPQSLNKYQYTYNNPLRYTDPTGHCVGILTFARPLCVKVAQKVIERATPYVAAGVSALGGAILNSATTNPDPSCAPCGRSYEMGQSLMKRNEQRRQSQQQNQNQSNTASPNPGNNNDKKPVFGEKGTQTTSTTVGSGKGWRVDVENANPGQRPGQIHYQSGDTKLLYDPSTKSFVGASKTQNRQLMNDPNVQRAIKKGMKMLGESQ